MIEARVDAAFARLAQGLVRQATALAQATVASRKLARRRAPARWRDARLVWPLFTRG